MQALSLSIQTLYADLIDRCEVTDFDRDFPSGGSFYALERNGRRYWYFKMPVTQAKRYAGPETPALLDRIKRHGQIKADASSRREIVRALVGAGLPAPDDISGRVLAALNQAGLFRLRAVLVSTHAFQTYAGLLGYHLPGTSLRTGDLDLAQFHSISTVVDDEIPPIIDLLRAIDPSFRAVPRVKAAEPPAQYANATGFRIDFLTANRTSDDVAGSAAEMPALGGAGALPLRFLDFLIYQPQRAAVLYGPGIFVWVPDPVRFAIHKLMLPARRVAAATGIKAQKDIAQATAMLEILLKTRPADVMDLWREASQRGPEWVKALHTGMRQLPPPLTAELGRVLAGS